MVFGKSGSKIHTNEEAAKQENQSKEDMKDCCRHKPAKDRRCHDCLCTGMFLTFWVGMIGIAMVGFSKGNPERLLYGTDYTGVPCNKEQVIYYPRLNQDLMEASKKGASFSSIQFYGVCVPTCPDTGTYVCDYDTQKQFAGLSGTALEKKQSEKVANPMFQTGPCWYVPLKSSPVMFRCFPQKNETSYQVKHCMDDQNDVYYDPNSATECNGISGAFSDGGGGHTVDSTAVTTSVGFGGRTLKPGGCLHYSEVTLFGGKKVLEPNDYCTTTETLTNTVTRGPTGDNPMVDRLQDTAVILGAYAGDLEKTLPEVALIGGAMALVFGVAWLLLMKYCASCIVWTTLTAVVVSMAGASLYCSYLAGMLGTQFQEVISEYEVVDAGEIALQEQEQTNKQSFEILAYLLWIATFILVVVVMFLRTKVKIAIGVIREAAKSLQAIPALIVFPFVPFFLALFLFMYFCGIAGFVYSAGDITLDDLSDATGVNLTEASISGGNITALAIEKFESTQAMQYMLWYHLFGFLWANALISAISMCTVAGSVSSFYWAKTKKTGPLADGFMGKRPILTALWCCFRYHFGSLCFGSLIVAIVQFIRIVLMYIDRQTKDLQQSNIAVKIFMKMVHCCMWCLEKIVKYISRNAYILIAMRGGSFCSSTFRAFRLIFSNLAQVGMLASISNLILLLVKITITSACGFLMFVLVDSEPYQNGGDKELSAPLLPVLFVLFLAYTVSTIFLNAYGLAIDTILLCFCEDKKANKPGQYFMSEELQKCIPGFKKAAAAAAAAAALEAEAEAELEGKGAPAEGAEAVPAAAAATAVVPAQAVPAAGCA